MPPMAARCSTRLMHLRVLRPRKCARLQIWSAFSTNATFRSSFRNGDSEIKSSVISGVVVITPRVRPPQPNESNDPLATEDFGIGPKTHPTAYNATQRDRRARFPQDSAAPATQLSLAVVLDFAAPGQVPRRTDGSRPIASGCRCVCVPDARPFVKENTLSLFQQLTQQRNDSPELVDKWFLDSDYDGRTFCITQAFFPDKSKWKKLAKALGDQGTIDEAAFEALSGWRSLPFPRPSRLKSSDVWRIAVKVIDPRGNEGLRVVEMQ